MTRKFFALFLATFALTVAAQATTPTETGNSTTTLKSALAAEQTADDEDEGLFWFDAGANIASNYLWRGYDQSYSGKMFDPSIQPSVTFGLGAFYLDLWLNVSPMSQYQEFDMTLGFDYKNLSITVYDVWCGVGKDFWQNDFLDGSNHNLTATIDYTFFDRLRLHWGTTFIHSADWLYNEDVSRMRRAFSSYFEVAYTQPVKELFDISFTAGASPWTGPFWTAGPQLFEDGEYFLNYDDKNPPVTGFNVTNLNIKLSREFEAGSVTFPVELGYTFNPTTKRHYALLKAGFSF
jgi:hypothetical protein